ncbi:hypothetical protein [Azotobacter beijerinckii]|uniref:hypothetical protein n=1 Tax=Azotobacter beijerinckii TaxID=170623 RepID=UPI002954C0D1|nr:hypothetical protein [Azotobacter beijerinckii]MDV7214142.1 hypothetical protein [Azotobacter beijerinckii]
MPYCTPPREAEQDWPRDFDIRAAYAEQQELLAPADPPAALPSPAQDTPHHD